MVGMACSGVLVVAMLWLVAGCCRGVATLEVLEKQKADIVSMRHWQQQQEKGLKETFLSVAESVVVARRTLTEEAELQALISIKQSLTDNHQALQSWNTTDGSLPCAGNWAGIKCAHGHVIALQLPNKGLSGQLSTEIGQLSALRKLNLHSNFISGTIPATLATLSKLRAIYLFHNFFSGNLPNPVSSSPALLTVDLSNNLLSGSIPPSLTLSPRIVRINLASNLFSSSIPPQIGLLSSLIFLDIKQNHLSGHIPSQLGNLTHLSSLDLSHNNLSGTLPPSLIKLNNLTFFNCSYNRLTGPVPSSLLVFNSTAFEDNPGLCGFSPTSPCALPSPAPTLNAPAVRHAIRSGKKRFNPLSLVFIIIGIVIVVFLLLCLFALLFLCCCRNAEVGKAAFPGEKFNQSSGKEGRVGGKVVHYEGTLGFAADDLLCATAEVLGKSTYGTVYKATLEDGNQVAVKRLREGIVKSQREFEIEVTTLGGIRHPNLLALRAYYWGPKDEKLLVYDFMPGGSLAAFLHARGPGTPLKWETRMYIAIGAARGLAYLHDHARIIHGNLTSGNILLDSDMTPKISDFGLSRLMTTAANSNVIATAGALGYRAPEFTKLRKASTKSDVYSFGIVLLELLTGKAPGEGSSSESGMDLADWVASIPKEDWTHEVFDLELMKSGRTLAEDELISMLQVAMTCVSMHALERPDMADVAQQLVEIMKSKAQTVG